ncbi:uncharacterized protein LAESUDRAFT_249907 [Laetiporus sulphureus 93-53]|uniref:Uncharacterized protein n=1 Tax=Laetiporus sulphureus 93-53 TaxID=1314785 RepID=A0A165DJ10_9APHY|nr:uncharacterized protein LAESUDRAFT_249907 [Laetiporus sulphureus 93-53]KZT04990.1 hypothetical protein LAESUDRAFT_249907 [Laetiporus sulphureus 93-53]
MPIMPHILGEKGMHEFPFPAMDAGKLSPASTNTDTLPSAPSRPRSSSSHTTSQRSDYSPPPRVIRNHAPRERIRAPDQGSDYSNAKSGLLARLLSLSREEHSAAHLHTLLAVTTDRLRSETFRADAAESRALDALHLLRQANQATIAARADSARATEELSLYRMRLEEAQKEILRAQELVNSLEKEKRDAEAEAARARTAARRWREESVLRRAREQGYWQGRQEAAVVKGNEERRYREGKQAGGQNDPRRYARRQTVMNDLFDEEEEEDDGGDDDAGGDDGENDGSDGSGSQPEEIFPVPRSPPGQQPPWRVQMPADSRPRPSRLRSPNYSTAFPDPSSILTMLAHQPSEHCTRIH